MRKNKSFQILASGFFLTFCVEAFSSDVIVAVAKSKRGACHRHVGDGTVHQLTVKETIKALEDYVHHRKTSDWFDAAFNGNGLRFCGTDERKEVFGHLIKNLKQGEPPQKVYDFIANYSSSETLLELIQGELKNKNLNQSFEKNLRRAEAVILEQRRDGSSKTQSDS